MMKEIRSVKYVTMFPENFHEKAVTNVQNKI